MIELPEDYAITSQLNDTLPGKEVENVCANQSPHRFAFYSGNPERYHDLLQGKKFLEAIPGSGLTCGASIEIHFDDITVVVSAPLKYHAPGEKRPAKHQLLIEFTDESALSSTVQMWGAIFCFPTAHPALPEGWMASGLPHPLMPEFDETYFRQLLAGVDPKYSVKAFLATEQRIPGVGNGVIQDVMFNARLHPKRWLRTLGDADISRLYHALVGTVQDMARNGGRDTERDLFGCFGGYRTILSKKTADRPCPVCGGEIIREAYLGGNIYYCPHCQPLPEEQEKPKRG